MSENTLLSLDQAAALQKSSSKKGSPRTRRQELVKQGERQKYQYAFKYADGRVSTIKTSAKAILALGLPLIMQDTALKSVKNSIGEGVHAEVVRSVLVKPLRYSLLSRVNKKTKKYEREWKTISIPKDAKILDILFNIKQWATKPEIVRINGENVLVKEPTGAAFKAAASKAKFLAKSKAILSPKQKAKQG